MKKHRVKSQFLVSLIISVSVTTTLYLFSFTSLYKSIKYSANDFKIKQYAKIELADPDIALVAIDELSMNKFSKLYNYHWPWPRQFYGIILDYFKKSWCRYSCIRYVVSRAGDRTNGYWRNSLRKSFCWRRSKRKVILGGALSENDNGREPVLPELELTFENADKMSLKRFRSVTPPLKQFCEVAGNIGIVHIMQMKMVFAGDFPWF